LKKQIFFKYYSFLALFAFFLVARQPQWAQTFPLLMFRDHTQDILHSVGLHWASDQSAAGTSTWQHTTNTRNVLPYPWWDSNSQSQQASDRSSTP